MPKSLNTSHSLYPNITSFICVDGGALTDLKAARTFTPEAGTSFGTGTYGEHFRTAGTAYTSNGAGISPAAPINTTTDSVTIMAVMNAVGAGANSQAIYSYVEYTYTPTLGILNGFAAVKNSWNGVAADGQSTVVVQSNGAHSMTLTRPAGNAQTMTLYVDGTVTGASTASGNGSAFAGINRIGPLNGQGSLNFDLVYLIVFNKILTPTEISGVYSSLGVNTMSLLNAAAAPTSISTTPGNAVASGTQASVLSANTIITAPGNAVASGTPAAVTNLVPGVVIPTATTGATASGTAASVGTNIQTGMIPNNNGSVAANTAVVWTWTPNGRVGSMVGLSPQDGTGTTDANGRLAPGIAIATGQLRIAVRNASAKVDDTFEQFF